MARTISWSNRLHEIRERLERSKIETWSRQDLEDLFQIRRAAAQMLMKAIGGIQNIGGKHFVERGQLLEFLERSIASDDLSTTVQSLKLEAGPTPRPKRLTFALPSALRHVMVDDLPDHILLEPCKLTIHGKDSEEIIESLYLLAQAMQNDLGTVQARLDPLVGIAEASDFAGLFERLLANVQKRA